MEITYQKKITLSSNFVSKNIVDFNIFIVYYLSMKLKTYLKRSKISQVEFARTIGVTQQAVSQYCSGYKPKRTKAFKIVKVTGRKVTLEDLWDIKKC